MTTIAAQLKKELRTKMRRQRETLAAAEKARLDQNINRQLLALIERLKPSAVHSYLPMGSEVDIMPVIRQLLHKGITVVCPKSLPQRQLEHLVLHSLYELEEGVFGTRHPAGNKRYEGQYELIIVPGLAFDHQGNRLGYGAGYYDSFLKNHPRALKVGVAYPFQRLEKIPTDPHDIALDQIIS